MQCTEAVQCQQAKSLFHDVVTDLLVCQSLEMNAEVGPFPRPATVQSFPMASMQCAEVVQCQQAESLFHDVVTDLLVCQSLQERTHPLLGTCRTAGSHWRRWV